MGSSLPSAIAGRTLVLTREVDDRPAFAALEAAGARLVWIPLVMQRSEPSAADAVAALSTNHFDDLVLTSANAVAAMADASGGVLHEPTRHVRVWVVGPATADAWTRVIGRPPDIVAAEATAEGLVAEARRVGVHGRRFLLPTARDARPVLQAGLEELGATVLRITTHATHPQPAAQAALATLEPAAVAAVVVASPSTVRALVALAPPDWNHVPLACIGPSTEAEARRLNRRVMVVASPHTMAGVAAALGQSLGLSARPS